MSKYFENSEEDNNEEIEKIVVWLKARFKEHNQKHGGRATNQPQDETQEGMEQDILTFLTAEIGYEGAEHQSLHKLFQALESNENSERKNKQLCKTCRDRELSDEDKDCKHCENNEGYQTTIIHPNAMLYKTIRDEQY